MIKKLTLVIIAMFLITIMANATVSIGQLDDAKTLKTKQKQIGGFFSVIMTPHLVVGDLFDLSQEKLQFSFLPIPIQSSLYDQDPPLLAIPRISLGFILRRGLKKNKEFSFAVFMSSPIMKDFGMMGPDIAAYIGIKKNVFQSKTFNFSYKFNVGAEYTALPGIELIIKNSLMFGTNKELHNFSLIISLQNSLGTVLPFAFMGIGLVGLETYLYATICPEIELSWSNHNIKGFTSNISLFFRYNVSVDLQEVSNKLFIPNYVHAYKTEVNVGYNGIDYRYHPTITGILKVGMCFAFQGRTQNK